MQLWLVWCILILLDVKLSVWAGPVMFYANTCLHQVEIKGSIIFIKHQNHASGAANY